MTTDKPAEVVHPIQGLHDRTQKDYRAMPPEQLAANKEHNREEQRRPLTAFQLETGIRSNPFDHEKDPSTQPPARQPGKVPVTAFELEMMGGRPKPEYPLDAQASATHSPPETDDERILRLQRELEMATVAKMDKEPPLGTSSPPERQEAAASVEKESPTESQSAPSKPTKKLEKPNDDLKPPSS